MYCPCTAEDELPTEAELVNREVVAFVNKHRSAVAAAAAAESALDPRERFARSVRRFNRKR